MSALYTSILAIEHAIERCLDSGEIEEMIPLIRTRKKLFQAIDDANEPRFIDMKMIRAIIDCEERCKEKAFQKKRKIAQDRKRISQARIYNRGKAAGAPPEGVGL